MINNNTIEIRNLSEYYTSPRGLKDTLRGIPAQKMCALDNISFEVKQGEIFGLVGENGAGKTTLLKILSTLLTPAAGKVTIAGFDVVKNSFEVRRMIGFVSSNERSFYWRLTGRQNLRFFARLYDVSSQDMESWIDELLEALGLLEVGDRRFDAYSTGMRQRLAFARALLGKPKVIYMDEPTKGLDPSSANALIRMLQERIIPVWQPTVIITSHQLIELEKLCDRIAILSRGKLLRCGTMSELHSSVSLRSRHMITIRHFSETAQAAVLQIAPWVKWQVDDDQIWQMVFDDRNGELSNVLAAILSHGGVIINCAEQTVSLEDIFSHVMATEVRT